jgi:hypothetical protein
MRKMLIIAIIARFPGLFQIRESPHGLCRLALRSTPVHILERGVAWDVVSEATGVLPEDLKKAKI